MQPTSDTTYVLPTWLRGWERFWFTPADPAVLALIRFCAGLVIVYSFFVYSFRLQELMGENAWYDLALRREIIDEYPQITGPLSWNKAAKLPAPTTPWQRDYLVAYHQRWGQDPPPPYPTSEEQAERIKKFQMTFGIDPRVNGLRPPETDEIEAWKYVEAYVKTHGTPPPAIPATKEESLEIDTYYSRFRLDPRMIYSKGTPVFSLWFHVTDPRTMAILHGLAIAVAIAFTVGFCTRISSGLLWFLSLCYIHRNPAGLFGVDTMVTIILFYLMMSPSGALFSVDHWLAGWWTRNKGRIVSRWLAFFGKTVPESAIAPATPNEVAPSVAANVAIRLLQVHVCIIYLLAGISKLQGQTWWNGSAIWLSMANSELAPMNSEIYLSFLRVLGSNQVLFTLVMTAGGYFTLAFEIGYCFLIWQPRMRWIFLGSAIMLHGFIGLFMGLQAFSVVMLIMNGVFLRKEEVYWLASWVGLKADGRT